MKSRRDFLRLTAATAGTTLLPPAIARALSIPANRATGTLQDVEHVVILMQENRSFDHYFGSLRGVRGFNDPRPAPLPNGQPVWHQPTPKIRTSKFQPRGLAPDATHVLPFYINPKATTEFQAGTDHGWSSGHLAWNNGRYDQWVTQKQDALTMGYLQREDLSFHYALADAFTICDAYHASVHGDTCPNRIYLWSGTLDPHNTLGKKPNGPGLHERLHKNGYTWTTYPERLQQQGITWKVYQGGTGIPGTPTDNYTDNSLEFFAQYQVQQGASPTSPLVTNGVTNHTLSELKSDVAANKLAQVTWIVAPFDYCEHPTASPTNGAHYISTVLDALTSNPDVWSKTVLFLNYDENDGLFDHIVPPMPPQSSAPNAHGMVSPNLVTNLRDEFLDVTKYPSAMPALIHGADHGGLQPIGLGPRVPMLVISPWSTGGFVCSQTFDHTSVLQFLEKRFGVPEPNITDWRRSVCGDLTSAFDFSQHTAEPPHDLRVPEPVHSLHEPYKVPVNQQMPRQEPGTRPARPLPYALETACTIAPDRITVDLINHSSVGAAFYIYTPLDAQTPPRRYTVSDHQTLTDFWLSNKKSIAYELSVFGPNGYHVHLRNSYVQTPTPEAKLSSLPTLNVLQLHLQNPTNTTLTFTIAQTYNSPTPERYTLAPGTTANHDFSVASSSGWYDLQITLENDPTFLRRFAGHLENGHASTSDPAPHLETAATT